MRYFASCTTLEALKKEYRRLCMIHHPDRGGDAATMAAINNEYDEAFHHLQHRHRTTEASSSTESEAEEVPEEFRAVISRLVVLAGIEIEICGSWIWVTGATYPNREALKAAGCRYSKNKVAWYWHPAGEHSRSRKQLSLDEIRQLHGSEKIKTRSAAVLTA